MTNGRKEDMKFKIKIIKTEEGYKEALKYVEELMSQNPDSESELGEQLNLLTTLIKDYEANAFPETLPDPIDAIKFRMEQADLKQTDLIPFIGSRSKVSEVLARKRPLTINMIRALEKGLGIPAKVLINEPDEFKNEKDIAWNRFPVREMAKRGYFNNFKSNLDDIRLLIEEFFRPVGSPTQFVALFRKSYYLRSIKSFNKQALATWSAYVVKRAKDLETSSKYKNGTIDLSFMQKVAKLSIEENGPILALNLLKDNGIILIIEPHFPQTYLDGATILRENENPVIGLTLRYDRLDNFWFTLMHELAHISLHSDHKDAFYYDDLDTPTDGEDREKEADKLAGEAIIPENKWINSPARLIPSPIAAQSLAKELGINIAIVAGKMRKQNNNYQYLNNIIGQAKIRKYFPEIKWEN